jgi:glyoxylase-like metal-dependent hydrolase (beta-lactamase superfamily II)
MCTFGRFFANCYLVSCEQTKEAILIDPSCENEKEAEKIFETVHNNKLILKLIVNTHGHPDHVCGNRMLKGRFRVPILIHEYDSHMLGKLGKCLAESFGFEDSSPPADRLLRDKDTIEFGQQTLKIIHTPGHSRGSISLLALNAVFTGDTLFAQSIGRTDFPESSEFDMNSSLKKLAGLPDTLTVYPGHGPTTTIGKEKGHNPFLQRLQS